MRLHPTRPSKHFVHCCCDRTLIIKHDDLSCCGTQELPRLVHDSGKKHKDSPQLEFNQNLQHSSKPKLIYKGIFFIFLSVNKFINKKKSQYSSCVQKKERRGGKKKQKISSVLFQDSMMSKNPCTEKETSAKVQCKPYKFSELSFRLLSLNLDIVVC